MLYIYIYIYEQILMDNNEIYWIKTNMSNKTRLIKSTTVYNRTLCFY